ncbi:VWA domain-containing protein [bacterium]|nr:VWA domain-containing protein [bacterium]
MFSHPERLLWILPIVALGFFWLRRYQVPKGVSPVVWDRLARESRPGRMRTVALLRWLALLCWLVAWAGPRWGVERIKVERTSYDIVFAVDCSRSMLAEDLPPSRKMAARQELTELIRRLEGNRFGLVGFAEEAFVFCPLTRDTSAATLFLEQLEENSFARQGTNLSKALQAAATLFPGKGNMGSRIIVLLSDGEDRHTRPVEVAKQLAQRNIVVYTVALGSAQGAPIPTEDGKYHLDHTGKQVVTKADEATLKDIAATTKGRCFRLGSSRDHLDGLVAAIQEHDRRRLEQELSSRKRHQYYWFVGLGLALLGLAQLLVPRLRRTA